MAALFIHNLSLIIKVYHVRKLSTSESFQRVINPENKTDSLVKVLEGWSLINLSDTYAMSSALEG